MAAESQTIDALGQFKLTTAFGPLGASVNFTQSNLMMLISCALVLGTLYVGMRPKALVPGRLQTMAELAYDGVRQMCGDTIGEGATIYARGPGAQRAWDACGWQWRGVADVGARD